MLKIIKNWSSKTKKVRHVRRAVDVLNWVPLPYFPSREWTEFVGSAKKQMEHTLDVSQADDLCDAIFDASIDTAVLACKKYAEQQHTDHLDLLWRQNRQLTREIARQASQKKIWEEKLAKVETKLRQYETV